MWILLPISPKSQKQKKTEVETLKMIAPLFCFIFLTAYVFEIDLWISKSNLFHSNGPHEKWVCSL